ncbi:hypothetical protein ISN45_Aa07g022370 [Arabidopsis thaliana x Arabidopsis arenosa]|uniref:Uncharacterized protein n=1 Tax=Arabidopsis thaliana x Arabidopsis arenosa TaxID=1240361 RepID=A0A8T1YAY3_9BRAS|nr:hypothetical protein ISN45_Aa07g022370 [Arabidopsis thaliana x Arabidopsis arenosa]
MDPNQQRQQLKNVAFDLLNDIAINLSQLYDLADMANNTCTITQIENVMENCENHAASILNLPLPNPPPENHEEDAHSDTDEELN